MRTLIYIVIFLLIGAFFIISNGNLHIGEKDDVVRLVSAYYSWIGSLFANGKSITGYVVNFRWIPELNETTP